MATAFFAGTFFGAALRAGAFFTGALLAGRARLVFFGAAFRAGAFFAGARRAGVFLPAALRGAFDTGLRAALVAAFFGAFFTAAFFAGAFLTALPGLFFVARPAGFPDFPAGFRAPPAFAFRTLFPAELLFDLAFEAMLTSGNAGHGSWSGC